MKFNFQPKTKLEKFGFLLYKSLVDNFPKTFFVGGTVRDFLLKKTTSDIDIATSAKPEEVFNILAKNKFKCSLEYKQFGTVIVNYNKNKITVTTFRKDLKYNNGYPKIQFVSSAKLDSQRRDFTINALYFSPNLEKIYDFYSGIKDLNNKKIKFIGDPKKRIHEDPIRILRALRFCLTLNFKLENQTKNSIRTYFELTKKLSNNKIIRENKKIINSNNQNIVKQILLNKNLLDKYFKK